MANPENNKSIICGHNYGNITADISNVSKEHNPYYDQYEIRFEVKENNFKLKRVRKWFDDMGWLQS